MKRLVVFLVLTSVGLASGSAAAQSAFLLPAPQVDALPAQATSETVVLAGGSFWGVQGVFQHVKGVTSALSGFAGGNERTANYGLVAAGTTDHAESVQVTYDPRQVSYERLLQIFFSVVHDPTQLNRQGSDQGTQYRSAIFPVDDEQARIAQTYIAQLDAAHEFSNAIVTTVEPGRDFYPAEDYHQDFMTRNPGYPYVVIIGLPKIDDLKRVFPDLYREDPVLVAGGATFK